VAATVRNSATATQTSTSGTTITVPLPTGWQAGDVVYIGVIALGTTASVTTPAGWSAVVASFRPSGNTNTAMAVFRRVMVGGDTAPAITTTAGISAGVSVAVQNADTVTPEDVSAATDVNATPTFPNVNAPSVSTVSANALLLTFHGERNGTLSSTISFTAPSGMTEVTESETAVASQFNPGVEVNSLALGAAGATGAKTATVSHSSGTTYNPLGATVAVRSAAATGLPDLVMARYGP
jgi:hypothetical protein